MLREIFCILQFFAPKQVRIGLLSIENMFIELFAEKYSHKEILLILLLTA